MALVQIENRAGKPVHIGGVKLIQIEKTTRVQPPGLWGILFWRRPVAVVVQHPDSSKEVLPIEDQTRQAQLMLLGIGLLGAILIRFYNTILK